MAGYQNFQLWEGIVNEAGTPQRDIDLHPVIPSVDKIVVSRFELNSLWKINQINSHDLEHYKTELELSRARMNELEAELCEEKSKDVVKEQKLALILTKLERMKSYFSEAKAAERSSYGDGTFDQYEQVDQSVEDVTSVLETFLKREQTEKEHLIKKCTQLQKCLGSPNQSERRHLENKLKQMEAMIDLLNEWNKRLETKNGQLSRKLDILYNDNHEDDCKDWTIRVKKMGRFEVKATLRECRRCHQTFDSTEEMQHSICHYHPAAFPVSSGSGCFWPCCYTKKDSVGCKHGDHVLTNKRQRTEE